MIIFNPDFGWLSTDIIKQTTTARTNVPVCTHVRDYHSQDVKRALGPAVVNIIPIIVTVLRTVATYTVYSGISAMNEWDKLMKTFVAIATDVVGMKYQNMCNISY